jgi:hypothetical protein
MSVVMLWIAADVPTSRVDDILPNTELKPAAELGCVCTTSTCTGKGLESLFIDVTSDLKPRRLLTCRACALHTLTVSVCAMLSIQVLSFDTDSDTNNSCEVREWALVDFWTSAIVELKESNVYPVSKCYHPVSETNDTYMDHRDHVFACDYCELGRAEK